MRNFKLSVIPAALSILLSACSVIGNGGTPETPVTAAPETFPETAVTTAVPETALVTTTAATEPPAVDDGFEHFWEMKFPLPERYEKDNFDLYNYYEYDYEDRNFFSGIGFDAQNSIFSYEVPNGLDGHVDYEYYCFLVEKFGAKSEKKEITVDGIKALQETVAIDMEDGFSTKLSAVTFETETAAYVISFEASGQESKEQLDIAFEAFNKMIKSIEITPEKRVPREFTDKLKDLVETPRTDCIPVKLPRLEFEIPETMYLEKVNTGTPGSTSYVYGTFQSEFTSERALTVTEFSHEEYPLINCSEELFRELSDWDIQAVNDQRNFVYSDGGRDNGVCNVKRLEIDGYPAVYFESADGFRNCMIIYMEDACRVIRVNEIVRIQYNDKSPTRYSDYVYGKLKILSPEEDQKDQFTDDLSEYISVRNFDEEEYIYFHGGKIAVVNPIVSEDIDGLSIDESVLRVGTTLSLAKYDGIPLELLYPNYFIRCPKEDLWWSYWSNPSEVETFLKGKYQGYNCVIVKFAETEDDDWRRRKQVNMYIDAEEYGKFVLTAQMFTSGDHEPEELEAGAMINAKAFFSSVKVGGDVVKRKSDFSGSIDDLVIRKEYSASDYTEVAEGIKLVIPEKLSEKPEKEGYVQYLSKDKDLSLVIEDISDDDAAYYYDMLSCRPGSYDRLDEARYTTIDGHNAILQLGTYKENYYDWRLYIFDVDEKVYQITISAEMLSSKTTALIKEILGSVRIEK